MGINNLVPSILLFEIAFYSNGWRGVKHLRYYNGAIVHKQIIVLKFHGKNYRGGGVLKDFWGWGGEGKKIKRRWRNGDLPVLKVTVMWTLSEQALNGFISSCDLSMCFLRAETQHLWKVSIVGRECH